MKLRSRKVYPSGKPRKSVVLKNTLAVCTRSMTRNTEATTIDHLPNELLLNIFARLNKPNLLQASKVCRRWSNIAVDFTLWDTIVTKDIPSGDDLSTGELVCAIRTQSRLKRVTLRWRNDCDAVLTAIARYSRNLETLFIFGCRGRPGRTNIKSQPLLKVLKSCRGLKELRMDGSPFRSCAIYRYLFDIMQGRLEKLRMTVIPNRREWGCLMDARQRNLIGFDNQIIIA